MLSQYMVDPWRIIETQFLPEKARLSESLMSIGNGYMGMRGNFEESYTGDTHSGSYLAGVWFPDKTRVGWWKNGYPAYFGKAINTVKLTGLRVFVGGEELDAAKQEVLSFMRTSDMQSGVLTREMTLKTKNGTVTITSVRFVSLCQKELLAISYRVTPSFDAEVRIESYLDANVKNLDSNYDESFWDILDTKKKSVISETKENPFGAPRFTVAAAMENVPFGLKETEARIENGKPVAEFSGKAACGKAVGLDKFCAVTTDRDNPADKLTELAEKIALSSADKGFQKLQDEHQRLWLERWASADVIISGDEEAQQGIRFNLYHLLSTYSGEDARLNIGPKGFTGEKYGGATYWDTEAYCFPVYLATAGEEVAKNLLLYRYQQLDGAFYNARQQGLPGALYPMVTFTGIECHNEWEITFEELHRNAAMVYAIFYYTEYTGDESYILGNGLDVVTGIARFWAGRVHHHPVRDVYMIHGVTGPNEYENNVNNNWYTNRMAAWCLEIAAKALRKAGETRRAELNVADAEIARFEEISEKMYLPESKELGIFVQHDTFLDKALMPASDIPAEERPINQHWSWDRILRSCFIKQADTLQGLYALGHLYDKDVKKRNFDFYEPMTVHESSLSPSVHSILASEIGYHDKAVEMYKRTARLDLDNINNDTDDGLHITSMSGSWLAIAQGFAGMRIVGGLSLSPFLPKCWKGYAFTFLYRKSRIRLSASDSLRLELLDGNPVEMTVYGEKLLLDGVYTTDIRG
ncbi:MAG: family 65 glycosyl hydrolase domain-containing protein [Eubacteriales bacterium]|nr:family 65 glycosyl hydrolase domain-containing protein [Eubacteriales bacterium]MDD3883092.1 family 65 glycosyl hydrolase domain-containing protein [Eubacteriales bacterium]MDD4512617.1 family 65 glycosyl hydrolase domain-containing protein [Eubacteriales bacterium]